MSHESVVEKIKKLLRKTEENGASPAEAASAIAVAQRLMLEYNVDESEVVEKEAIVDIVEEKVSVGTKTVNSYQWLFADGIAKHFGCRVFRIHRVDGSQALKFVGEGYKVESLKECFLFAYKTYMKYSSKFLQSPENKHHDSYIKARLRSDYFRGFLDGLTNELIKSENEYALVPVESEALKEHISKMSIHTTQLSQHSLLSYSAQEHGYQDGSFAVRNRNSVLEERN